MNKDIKARDERIFGYYKESAYEFGGIRAEAIASVISASAGTVCAVCGLERMGHGVESSWLEIPAHYYAPRVASKADTERARMLTRQAYAARCERNLCGAYCQATHVTQVTPN